jgi:hypothetical protein
MQRRSSQFGFLGALLGCLAIVGCGGGAEQAATQRLRRQQAKSAQVELDVDHLSEAIGYLRRYVELEPTEAAKQIVYHLNAKLPEQAGDSQWKAPALLSRLPEPLTRDISRNVFESPTFITADAGYLSECWVLSRIVRWVTEAPMLDERLEAWLKSEDNSLDASERRDLRTAIRLFDWVVCNIQLEPMQVDEAGLQAGRFPWIDFPMTQLPPDLKLPSFLEFQGPGYRRQAFDTIWLGTGDFLQRSAAFLLLCRQAGLDACTLGLKNPQSTDASAPPIPWLLGVRIGQRLFLFEPQLGLPVPGPQQRGVATLDEARNDPTVLRRLNVPGWFEYPVQRSAVGFAAALVDVPPAAMSGRMARLQEALTGSDRMVVAVDADALGERLAACRGVTESQLWVVPFQAIAYAEAIAESRRRNPLYRDAAILRQGIIRGSSPMAKARWAHLTGRHDAPETERPPAARVSYLGLRRSEAEIDRLPIEVELQDAIGLRRQLGQDDAEWEARIQIAQQQLRSAKMAAGFWLGCLELDSGRWESAAAWFQKRTLDPEPNGQWAPGARFALARAEERLDRTDRAIELLKTSGDPQEHGNRIRARLLSRDEESAAKEESAADADGQPQADEEASAVPADPSAK